MSVLKEKKILLGITAGIAAYKTASLVRLFIKLGAEVKVIMTPASKDFITPLTLSTLSKNQVHSTFYSKEDENELWNNHVELGLWADYMLIAPATAILCLKWQTELAIIYYLPLICQLNVQFILHPQWIWICISIPLL
jgi:phosphopantothenoylcysteine synthetase/decarboxylase